MDIYYVVIKCPNTGRGTRTGLELSEFSAFEFVGLMPQTIDCQHCNARHTWTKKDAWMERHGASRVHVRPAIAQTKSL
jgi:hypothetical protein